MLNPLRTNGQHVLVGVWFGVALALAQCVKFAFECGNVVQCLAQLHVVVLELGAELTVGAG